MPLSPFQNVTIRKGRRVVIFVESFGVDRFRWVTIARIARDFEASMHGEKLKIPPGRRRAECFALPLPPIRCLVATAHNQ